MPKTTYVWDELSDNVIEEYEDGVLTVSYTHEPGLYGKLLSQNRNGVISYYHYDGRGNTVAITDDSGNVTDTKEYEAWGNVIVSTGSTVTPYQFGGRQGYQTGNTGVYVRARVYQPKLSVWSSLDAILPPIGQWYRYASCNPTNRFDPSGMLCTASNCGPDVTDWYKRQIEIIRNYRDENLNPWDREFQTLMSGLKFEQADNGLTPTTPSCPTKPDCTNSLTLCGKCRNRTDLGNIAYGYVADFSLEITLWGGLMAQLYHGRGIDKPADLYPILCGWAFRQKYFMNNQFPNTAPSQDERRDLCHYLNNQVSVGGQAAFDPAQMLAINALYLALTKGERNVLSEWRKKFGQDAIKWLQTQIIAFEGLKDGCLGHRDELQPKATCAPCEEKFRATDLSVNPDGTITWGTPF